MAFVASTGSTSPLKQSAASDPAGISNPSWEYRQRERDRRGPAKHLLRWRGLEGLLDRFSELYPFTAPIVNPAIKRSTNRL